MIEVLKMHQLEIDRLCRLYRVDELYVFGSAAKGDFDPLRSDVDLLVKFSEQLSPTEYADAFFGLQEALERLLRSPIDLVTVQALSNPYFRASVEASEQLLYAA